MGDARPRVAARKTRFHLRWHQRNRAMTKKIALTTSILLLTAISGAAAQDGPSVRSRWSPTFVPRQAPSRLNAFDSVAPMSAAESRARRYHGGPKSND